jgi:hypothetical protein
MDRLTKAQLFADGQLFMEEFDIPGMGSIFVRGLNRLEAHIVAACGNDVEGKERKILSFGVVDPELTDADVRSWMKAAPSDVIDKVVTKIAELSGMVDGADKLAYKSNGQGPVD